MSDVSIEQVIVEHHESGFGIGHSTPRLSWRFAASSVPDWVQSSYEIEVQRNDNPVDRCTIESSQSVLVPWPSSPLNSRDVARIKVRAVGSDGTSTDWAAATAEVGLLQPGDWKGDVISGVKRMVDEAKRPLFVRKTFSAGKTTNPARLYSTALGIYEVYVNDKRVGSDVLKPGWRDYNYHLTYQTYDIGALLKPGENTITAYVGEGYYSSAISRPKRRNNWGDQIGFLCQVEIDKQVVCATDDGWEWGDGPVLLSEIYDGELVDTKLWTDKTWWLSAPAQGQAVKLDFAKSKLQASDAPPVRRRQEFAMKEIITTPSGKTVVDFGQNLTGWVRINEDLGSSGKVIIRHAEVVEKGEIATRPLRNAKATDTIILGGITKGWEPKFTYHGFRYIEVTGFSNLSPKTFSAIHVSSDLRRTGSFTCSHPLINKLYDCCVWSMKNNYVSIPHDCPARDERLGWTGDVNIFTPTANLFYDTAGFYKHWLQDLYQAQKDHGGIPPEVVPHIFMGVRTKVRPLCVWADASIMIPWNVYQSFGDVEILRAQYDSAKLWLDQGVPRKSNGLWIREAPQYADWLDPRAPPQYPALGSTDTHMVCDSYLVHVTRLAAKIADLIKEPEDAKRYSDAASKLFDEFSAEYVTPKGRVNSDTQTAYALALSFGLLKEEQRIHAAERLGFLVGWDGYRIATGFVGTAFVLEALASTGNIHLAYRMLQEGDCPSWLYPLSMGATTMWERWDSMYPDGTVNPGQMTGFNHFALGSVSSFLHERVGGLSCLQPGWSKALIRPQPGGTIRSAATSYSSVYGTYSVSWEIRDDKLIAEVQVPPNGSAKVILPGLEEDIGSGSRSYTVPWVDDKRWPPSINQGPDSVVLPDRFVA